MASTTVPLQQVLTPAVGIAVPLENTQIRSAEIVNTQKSTTADQTAPTSTIWTAIQQHPTSFIVIIALVFAIGYLYSKNK